MFACGCKTESKAEKEKKEAVGALRVHIESTRNLEGTGKTISLIRSQPVTINIANDVVLTEASLVEAHLADVPDGGYAIEVKFDDTGTYTLEQFSAANPGRHFAIFGQWGKKLINGRWLAAPLINHRITNGVLIFTPDASHEEAEQLVNGLENVARKNVKAMLK